MIFLKKQFLLFFLLLNTLFLQAQAPTIWAGSIDPNYHPSTFFWYSQTSFYSEIDNYGDHIIAGTFRGQTDFDIGPSTAIISSNYYRNVFVQKMDANGNLLWVVSFNNGIVDGLTYDQDNNILVTGRFWSTVDFDPGPGTFSLTSTVFGDQFIVKLDPQGNFIWAKGIISDGTIYPKDIQVDHSNNVLVVGNYSDSTDFDPGTNTFIEKANHDTDAYLLKLDANGDFLWVKSMGNVSQGDEIIHTVAVDDQNNIYTGGSFHIAMDVNPGVVSDIRTSNGWQDVFLQKLDSSGNFIWAHTFGSAYSELPYHISLDNNNNVVLSGSQGDAFDADPTNRVDTIGLLTRGGGFFMVKYNTNGDYLWGHNIGEATNEKIGDFEIDSNNNILIIGTFQDTSDFYPGIIDDRLEVSIGVGDAYLLQLDSLGNYLWHQTIAASQETSGMKVNLDKDHNIYCLGAYHGTLSFPDNSSQPDLVSNGDTSLFILKLGPFVNSTRQITNEEWNISIYPNPTQEVIFIQKEDDLICDYTIVNPTGQILMEQTSSDNITNFDLSKLAAGVYYLKVQHKKKIWTTKIVKR